MENGNRRVHCSEDESEVIYFLWFEMMYRNGWGQTRQTRLSFSVCVNALRRTGAAAACTLYLLLFQWLPLKCTNDFSLFFFFLFRFFFFGNSKIGYICLCIIFAWWSLMRGTVSVPCFEPQIHASENWKYLIIWWCMFMFARGCDLVAFQWKLFSWLTFPYQRRIHLGFLYFPPVPPSPVWCVSLSTHKSTINRLPVNNAKQNMRQQLIDIEYPTTRHTQIFTASYLLIRSHWHALIPDAAAPFRSKMFAAAESVICSFVIAK